MNRWLRGLSTGVGLAAAGYAAYVGAAWYRYGRVARPLPGEEDHLLDQFMPAYEIAERHHIRVDAPADVTLAAAQDIDLQGSAVARSIMRARELILGAIPYDRPDRRGLLAEMQWIGWGVLAEVPGREVVVGAVTRPWEANVTFRAIAPDRFASFTEPGYVKIAWTLRSEPLGVSQSMFRTETRAIATDASARRSFRRYWSLVSPGIIIIRWTLLGPLKAEAERRARQQWTNLPPLGV